MAETHFIEVVAGKGQPPSLELRPGVELAPLSVGTGGAWQVSAAGVRLVHLYVYFDGQTLFLQSAEAEDPPKMDGRPVPAAWTSVPGRCVITFGQAQLVFRPAEGAADDGDEDERTVAMPLEQAAPQRPMQAPPAAPPPGARPPTARPFKPGAFAAPVDESTRLQPLEDFLASGPPSGDSTRVEPLLPDGAAGGVPNIRPAAGAPWRPPAQPPPASQPASVQVAAGGGGPPSGLLNIAPPSIRKPDAPETFGQKMSREWKAMPVLKKILLVVAMPIGLTGVVWLILGGMPGVTPQVSPTPSASTSAAGTATAPTAAPGAASTAAVAASQTAPPPPPPPPGTSPPVIDTRPVSTATTPPPPPPPPPATTGDAGADRRERQAADFVATHAYEQAIRIYEQLATEHPDKPAFHEAARILREKLESGKP